jgi:FKBP-type peptidyl-prolyl cis-trans isomerase FkpA
MKRLFYLTGLVALLASCNSFKKTKTGLLYKIISNGQGQKLENGDFFEIAITQRYKDSQTDTVLQSSDEKGTQIGKFDSLSIPPDYYQILSKARQGDSIVVKLSTDTILKKNPNVPPFIKRNQFIVTSFKIVNVFTDQKQADSAKESEMSIMRTRDSLQSIIQASKDDKIISDYLAKNNIKAVKAPLGTYVEIVEQGTGDAIDTSKVAKVFYTGRAMSTGKPFDSNTDSAFHHFDAISVDMNPERPGMIKGWLDGLPLLKKGAKARFYIPSTLGYGARGAGQDIKPNENLIFDINISDVITPAQARAEAEAARAKQMAQQKHVMDSIMSARHQDSLKKGLIQ